MDRFWDKLYYGHFVLAVVVDNDDDDHDHDNEKFKNACSCRRKQLLL